MQNIKAVRELLLEPKGIDDAEVQERLKLVFDYLVEEDKPEAKIRILMLDLVQGERICAPHRMPPHLITPEAAMNIVKALAYGFPDDFQLIPEIALLDFRVHASSPTIYKEDKGVHAMIIVTLLGLADDEAFDSRDKFNDQLTALLIEGLQKRYFRNSIIYSHQVSLLSSTMKKFVERAHAVLFLSKARWNSLCHIIDQSGEFFSGGDDKKPGDASLEYALLNELCFKLFNECSLETKAALLRSHRLSVSE